MLFVVWGLLVVSLAAVQEYRRQQTVISSAAANDITAYAGSLSGESAGAVAAQARDASSLIVQGYGGLAAQGAGLFYEENRPSAGFYARVADPSVGSVLRSDLGWALAPLFNNPEAGFADFLSRIGGLIQKHTARAGRDTIIDSAAADVEADGVRRVARVNACAFCRYLVVIEAETRSDTVWHNNCHCVNVPLWPDSPMEAVSYESGWSDSYQGARERIEANLARAIADSPNARRGNLLRANPRASMSTENILHYMRKNMGIAH